MVVLDTDHLSVLEWETDSPAGKLLARLSQLDPDEAVTTIINFEEQMRGWLAYLARVRTLAQQLEAYRHLQRHLDNYRTIPTLEFDSRAAAEFQRLRRSFRRIGTMDLKIAAIVLVHNATLLSRNLSDFGKLPGLKVEDWTR